MYVIPLVLVLVIALAMLASPLFAVGLAIPVFLGFLVYVGLNRRADERAEPSAADAPSPEEGHESGGIWGER
jgi:cytosine/uracil/thiamine/allantoin permease